MPPESARASPVVRDAEPGRRGAARRARGSAETAGFDEPAARRGGDRRHRAGHQPVAPRARRRTADPGAATCRRPTRVEIAGDRPRPRHGRRRSAACRTATRPAARRATGSARCGGCPTSSTSTRRAGDGTVVVSRVGRHRSARGSRPRYAGRRHRCRRRTKIVCGDTWRVAERDGELAVMVADGLGHGPLAAEAATRAVRRVRAQRRSPTRATS